MKTIDVVAAVIEDRYRYLLLRRAPHKSQAGKWEFPGGKIEPGESPQGALTRELKEELDLDVQAGALLGSVEVEVSGEIIRLFAMEAKIDSQPKNLRDHDAQKWVSYDELSQYPMTPADTALVHQLQGRLAKDSEILAINPKSAAKVCFFVYGSGGVLMSLTMLVAPQYYNFTNPALPLVVVKFFAVFLLPLVYAGAGFVMGYVVATFYNILANLFGGIKVRMK